MKTNDLYLEYARVIELCKGTALEDKPWKCIKCGDRQMDRHPNLQGNFAYEFAVAILEDKPVFIGDVLYDKLTCYEEQIVSGFHIQNDEIIINNEVFWATWRTDATWVKTKQLRRIILEDTGETRPPVVGEYVRTDVGFTKCLFPYVFIKDCEIWVEVKP